MTKAAALQEFYSSFDLNAYEENSVYDEENDVSFPYLTYELITDSFGGGDVFPSVSLWYRSELWTAINEKTEEISKAIGRSGLMIPCDDGYIWIKRGSPFAQSMGDDTDDSVKRKVLKISMEFLTDD